MAARIRECRVRRGATIEQAATVLGIDRDTQSLTESARRDVPLEELDALAKWFGVTVAWMIGEDETARAGVTR